MAALLCIPVVIGALYIPYMEFLLFYMGFAMFAAGAFAGRTSYMASSGFAGSYAGAFVGLYVTMSAIYPIPWMLYFALIFPLAAGLGGMVTGRLGSRRLDKVAVDAPKVRRCPRCGAQVGVSARRCWDCHAALPSS